MFDQLMGRKIGTFFYVRPTTTATTITSCRPLAAVIVVSPLVSPSSASPAFCLFLFPTGGSQEAKYPDLHEVPLRERQEPRQVGRNR